MQDITYTAHVESPASGDDLRRLHEEVELTCPVLNTIRYPVGIQRNSES
ncbi:MAG: OsmC family protein [Anaerolineae bacterium]|nr:OsmC family protein [Anaerolineae bacterium]